MQNQYQQPLIADRVNYKMYTEFDNDCEVFLHLEYQFLWFVLNFTFHFQLARYFASTHGRFSIPESYTEEV